MSKYNKGILKKAALIVGGLLILSMVIGSFVDYSLSVLVHNEKSVYGNIFAAFGEAPAMLGLVTAGMLLFFGRNKEKKCIGWMQIFFSAVLVLFGTLMLGILPSHYLEWPPVLFFIFSIVAAIAIGITLPKLCKESDRKTMVTVAILFVIAIMGSMIVINMIKVPWERPRMRLLAVNKLATFAPWWKIGGDLKETLTGMGVLAEEFKSFPSGHTGNSAMMLLLVFIPILNPKYEKKLPILLGIGLLWVLLVGFSRIIMGAHFLTDVTMGFGVSYLFLVILLYCYNRKLEENKSESVFRK